MNSRERILCALDHKEPDRIPIDFSGHRSSGIMIQAYIKLRDYLGLPPSRLYLYDFIQQLVVVEDDVLDLVGADVIELGNGYQNIDNYWQDWQLQDGTWCKIPGFIKTEKTKEGHVVYGDDGGIIAIQKNGCLYFEQTVFPLMDSEDRVFSNLDSSMQQIMWCKLGTPPAPAGFDSEGLKIRKESAKNLRQKSGKAIYGTFGGNLMEMGQFMFRMDNFLYELAADPPRMQTFLDRLTEYHMRNLERYLGAVGEYIDIIGFGDDLGMQTGPQISPQMYREFFKPRHKMLWNYAKKLCPRIKVSLHCCGGVYPLLRDLIDAGLDVINPVQFTCKDMELGKLKKEFGKDLVFWGGGCDTRTILPSGTPEQIKEHVKQNIEIMSPDGGFVFQQVHNIMADVAPNNIAAMFAAVHDFRRFPA